MPTVFTMGEALIDFIPHQIGVELKEVESFRKAAGGAPANVACAVSRLGGGSAFIGKLGADAFGDFLIATMQNAGVDTSRVIQTKEANTALAFVSLKADGNRDFSFYRSPSADMLLNENEIGAWFNERDILHFCSVDLIEAPVKYAHLKAIFLAKEAGAFISFDPNVRLPLWNDAESCRQTILEFLPLSHMIKISDEELEFITGIQDEDKAIASLFVGDVQHIIYTRGAKGAVWYTRSFEVSEPGVKVDVIDTTGAGDAFIGALLYQISEMHDFDESIKPEAASRMLAFANKAAAITTTRTGAIPGLPTLKEVESG
ncbi:carbohydrate kinase [Paenibacillus zeisoli]|uniref:Carbohydrate kinase n=1 Tax=Paenibacillus zeisoli TaxID=2496267 RepID=A0A3S1DUE7_9BACL|nr:carbohydrate kinase [Paenibacillus zeisoli]RUT27901.1 carbohydrate kinase [Paenibacillus zeisoli]